MPAIDLQTARRFILGKQGLWLEDEALGRDAEFARALARGFARLAAFLGAERMDGPGLAKLPRVG